MPLFHIIILALVQGITEFLPISSSGHLVITHTLLGQNIENLCWEQNRIMDVAVHIGTLFAVLLYFRKDLFGLCTTCLKTDGESRNMIIYIISASIPVIIAGFVMELWEPSWICLLEITAWTTLIFGIILGIADKKGSTGKTLKNLTLKDALIIGASQVLALVPGTSRSGITMTAGRFLGYSRVEAARFSLFLAIIAISGAGALGGMDLLEEGHLQIGADVGIAIAFSFISAWVALAVMMKWLEKFTFMPFVYYRVVMGLGMLALIYSGVLG